MPRECGHSPNAGTAQRFSHETTAASGCNFRVVDRRDHLNTLLPSGTGWDQVQMAYDINEKGQIAGYGVYMGQGRGFIMTP